MLPGAVEQYTPISSRLCAALSETCGTRLGRAVLRWVANNEHEHFAQPNRERRTHASIRECSPGQACVAGKSVSHTSQQ